MALEIHTVDDLMKTAAQALRDRDVETLRKLGRIVENWLQPREETEAQQDMLNAMMEAADLLEMYEGE